MNSFEKMMKICMKKGIPASIYNMGGNLSRVMNIDLCSNQYIHVLWWIGSNVKITEHVGEGCEHYDENGDISYDAFSRTISFDVAKELVLAEY